MFKILHNVPYVCIELYYDYNDGLPNIRITELQVIIIINAYLIYIITYMYIIIIQINNSMPYEILLMLYSIPSI